MADGRPKEDVTVRMTVVWTWNVTVNDVPLSKGAFVGPASTGDEERARVVFVAVEYIFVVDLALEGEVGRDGAASLATAAATTAFAEYC